MEIKKMADVLKSPKGGKGFTYHREQETPTHYIYRQVSNYSDNTIGYIVFKRKVNTMYNCESFPGMEQFGQWAWHYSRLSDAVKKLNSLTSN